MAAMERSLQAAALQLSIKRLEEECQQKLLELSRLWAVVPQMPPLVPQWPTAMSVTNAHLAAAAQAQAMAQMNLGALPPGLSLIGGAHPGFAVPPQIPVGAPPAMPVVPTWQAPPSLVSQPTLASPSPMGQIGLVPPGLSLNGTVVPGVPVKVKVEGAPTVSGGSDLDTEETGQAGDDTEENAEWPKAQMGSKQRAARLSAEAEAKKGRDTLRAYLTEMGSEDPSCIFITRRINKLGFKSREILFQHFSKYGAVSRVLVAHSKVKPFKEASGELRTRPGSLGLVVMKEAPSVTKILALGEAQTVAGHPIMVQSFERPQAEKGSSESSGASTTAGSSQSPLYGQRSSSDSITGSAADGETPDGQDTLRAYLSELSAEDPACIFITRRINKLGFKSKEILLQHFAKHGAVSRVLVAHSKVKPFRDATGELRTRPGSLGLVVMKTAASVQKILALGEAQTVAGHPIIVQSFERPQADKGNSDSSGASTTTGSSQRSQYEQRSSDSGSGPRSDSGSGSEGS